MSFNSPRAPVPKLVLGCCFSSRPEQTFSCHSEALSPCDQSGATAARVAARSGAKTLSPCHVQMRSGSEAAPLMQRCHSKVPSPGPFRPQNSLEAGRVIQARKASPRASPRPSPRPSPSASLSASTKASPMLSPRPSPRASPRVTPGGTPFPTLLPRRGGEMPGSCSSALFPAQALIRCKDELASTRTSIEQECAAVKCTRRKVSFGAVEILEVESWKSETSGASNGSMLECDCCERFFPRSGKGKDKPIQCFEKTTWVCSSCLQKMRALRQTTQLRGVTLSESIRLTKLQSAKPVQQHGEVDLQCGLLHTVKPLPHALKVKVDMEPQLTEPLPKPKTCQLQQDIAQQPRHRSPQPHGSIEKARQSIHSEKVRFVPSTCQSTVQAVAHAEAARKKKPHFHQHPSLCGFGVLELFTGQSR